MQLTPIPSSFVRKHLNLSWKDALWGYEHQMIGWPSIVDLAMDRLCAGSNDTLEIELSGLNKMEVQQIGELLRKLADTKCDGNKEISQRKWLYLILAWLFENKTNVPDPLGQIETIYADFDYPVEVESFVRYMPVTDGYNPSLHSKDENEIRLYENWQKYLTAAKLEFAQNPT